MGEPTRYILDILNYYVILFIFLQLPGTKMLEALLSIQG